MGLFNKKELAKIAELEKQLQEKQFNNNILVEELNRTKKELDEVLDYMQKNKITDCMSAEQYLNRLVEKTDLLTKEEVKHRDTISVLENRVAELLSIKEQNEEDNRSALVTLNNIKEKTKRLRRYSKDVQDAIYAYHAYENEDKIDDVVYEKINELEPTVELKLNCLDMKELRKEYKENEKKIDSLLDDYAARYTTKANQTIYKLMVIGLRAELQNTLLNLKYEKENISIDYIHNICEKYRVIASEGNQSIAKTINRFIAEIEILFKNAIHIEYEYYVQKERQRAEQAAIREQMKQEAEEKRILEQQKKQVEKEELKYHNEISNLKETMMNANEEMRLKYETRLQELENLLSQVQDKKDEIISRQNGKAGNVYVISNLGSFGENVFKVGMTRRLEPMERVRELGDASVPFSFDVHAMIFSEDAVGLEAKLHNILNEHRLNKINLRKEFFKIDLDSIETIVLNEDPSASFNRTMLAEEYRQSISIEEDIALDND